ncbi:MAG: AmmeMemoRadiSam system protein A [Chromatiales bacterium]|jgi:AmmeMemoRadiSam system protein A
MSFTDAQKKALLQLARDSIRNGLDNGAPLQVNYQDYETDLQQPLACFVTLNKHGELRGCIGHLTAMQSLVEDVVENAYSAAFSDPRFPPLQPAEFEQLEVEISVLSRPEAMHINGEQDLLEQIRPQIDGLILEDNSHRGTFLPSVWESLPQKEDFLRHLKMKAGLLPDYWSDQIRVSRYTTESFSDH